MFWEELKSNPRPIPTKAIMSQATKVNVFTAYKRVDKKVKPVPTVFPEDAKVKRQFPEDPLDSLPNLPSHPPVFIPTQRPTTKNIKLLNIYIFFLISSSYLKTSPLPLRYVYPLTPW